MHTLFFAVDAAPKNVEGVEQESVEIRVRLSAPALERLRSSSVPSSSTLSRLRGVRRDDLRP